VSTRAIIAYAPDPKTRDWSGVYSHGDGYPSGLGRILHELCAGSFGGDAHALGVYATREHSSWSSIVAPDEEPEYGGCHCHGPNAEIAPGDDSQRYHPDDLTDPELHTWIEWVYIIEPERLIVLAPVERGYKPVGHVAWTETPTDEDWTRIECGENYERCKHYAWVHFDVPEASKRLGTAKWLGREPLDPVEDAIGWRLVDGTLARRGGHGFSGSYYGRARGWYEGVTLPDGSTRDLRVCLGERTRRLRSDLTPVFPPTRPVDH
jgi:hypothetical protein